MKKPKLKDFGLTNKLLEQNEIEHVIYNNRLEDFLKDKKTSRKNTLIFSIVITAIIFLINVTMGFESQFTGISLVICLLWDVPFGLYYFQMPEESTSDLSYEIRSKIENEVINQQIEETVKKYKKAVDDYEKKVLTINENSLVKVDMLLPWGESMGGNHGVQWIVFSNIYLANSRSYPNIETPLRIDRNFEDYYNTLIEKQKLIPPKPKKHLKIEEEMKFYYPFSDMFFAMKGKRSNDTAELLEGAIKYKILNVINPNCD